MLRLEVPQLRSARRPAHADGAARADPVPAARAISFGQMARAGTGSGSLAQTSPALRRADDVPAEEVPHLVEDLVTVRREKVLPVPAVGVAVHLAHVADRLRLQARR